MKNSDHIPIIFLCTYFNVFVSVDAFRNVCVVLLSCHFPDSTFHLAFCVDLANLLVCGWVSG